MLQPTPIYPAVAFQENGASVGAKPSVQTVQLGRVCCNPLRITEGKRMASNTGACEPVSCRILVLVALSISKYEDHVNGIYCSS
jgi:hypothetical protein